MTDQEKNGKLADWLGVERGKHNFLNSIIDAWKLVKKMNDMYMVDDGSPEEEMACEWARKVGPLYGYKTTREAARAISEAVLEVIQ